MAPISYAGDNGSQDQFDDLLNRFKPFLTLGAGRGPQSQRQPWDERMPDGQMQAMPPVRMVPPTQRNSAAPQIQPASGQQDPARLNPRNKLQPGELQLSTQEDSTAGGMGDEPMNPAQVPINPRVPPPPPSAADSRAAEANPLRMPEVNAARVSAGGLSRPFIDLRDNPGNLFVDSGAAPAPWSRTTTENAGGQIPMPPLTSFASRVASQSSQPNTRGALDNPALYEREPGSGLLRRGAALSAQNSGAAATQSAPASQIPIPTVGPEPTRGQFMPQMPHGGRKALGLLAAGAGAFANPRLGAQISDELFQQPKRDAEWQFEDAHKAWSEEWERARQAAEYDLNQRRTESLIQSRNAPKNEKTDALNQQYLEAERNLANAKTPEEKTAAQEDLDRIERAATLGQKGNQTRNTNPFEAFAYGNAQEKQAAQDFLTFEKEIGSKYEKPGEVEQRYELYQRDPEAYKSMFGDRGAAQDSAAAARMLTYFNRRRQEIQSDWTLDEPTKAQQLQEVEQLAAPYLNPGGGGSDEKRITVISPKGITGTIPRSQLPAAKRNGYKLSE